MLLAQHKDPAKVMSTTSGEANQPALGLATALEYGIETALEEPNG